MKLVMARNMPDRTHLFRKAMQRPQSRHQLAVIRNPSNRKIRKGGSQMIVGPEHPARCFSVRVPSQMVSPIPRMIGSKIGQRGRSGLRVVAGVDASISNLRIIQQT